MSFEPETNSVNKSVSTHQVDPILIVDSENDNKYPAKGRSFEERFRDVISDPLNLLIRRHPLAGTVTDGLVTLHNGHRVPIDGEGVYYGGFSRILIYNRGVHEPLEEFAFQCLLPYLPAEPVMLELGSYWAHYSMWMAQFRPGSLLHLVEPDAANLAAGEANFRRHGYRGCFTQAFVGSGDGLKVDDYMRACGLDRLTLLHSDIQGHELDMLTGAATALAEHRIDWLFVSTHSQHLHQAVITKLQDFNYRIEVSSDFETHTTSFDGFIMAAARHCPAIMANRPPPLGRAEIATASPQTQLARLSALLRGSDEKPHGNNAGRCS
jgi:hypothetical protein